MHADLVPIPPLAWLLTHELRHKIASAPYLKQSSALLQNAVLKGTSLSEDHCWPPHVVHSLHRRQH